MQGSIVEVVRFKLKSGVNDEAFLQSLAATTAFLSGRKGFVNRRLLQGEDGGWLDLVEWATLDDAQAAAAAFSPDRDPGLAAFIGALDMSEGTMQHFAIRARHNG
jgi:hypothetical protein